MSTRSDVQDNCRFALAVFRHAKRQGVDQVDESDEGLQTLIDTYLAAEEGPRPDHDTLKMVKDAIYLVDVMDDDSPSSYILGLEDVLEEVES